MRPDDTDEAAGNSSQAFGAAARLQRLSTNKQMV